MKSSNNILLSLIGIIFMGTISLLATTTAAPKIPTITVWIHGTKSHEFLINRLSKLAQNLEVKLFGYKQGLHKVASFTSNQNNYVLAKELSDNYPQQFPWEHFYVFGWSGKLNHTGRQLAAKDLYHALKELVLRYQKEYCITPQITLITHSHGGNVALNMAAIVDKDYSLIINRLILLACPVQNYTMDLVKSPLFKRIYSIHSHTDMLQILDPQGLHPFLALKRMAEFKNAFNISKKRPLFSRRHFPINPKIAHACIRWKKGVSWKKPLTTMTNSAYFRPIKVALQNIDKIKSNRGLLHIEFTLLPFVSHLPDVIAQLDDAIKKTTHCISNTDPDIVIHL
ncbi:MAG TPA: hypothetical protein ENI08_03590 [Candidatus Dependentiae bacterium]|nr:hypothetical protein [Candidatus Dependentiae bacterium]